MSQASQLSFLESSTGTILVPSTATAISTQTGALIVQGGTAIVGNLVVGGTVTVNGSLSGSVQTAVTATNLAAGTAGQIHYQVSPGISGFAGPGTAGQILLSAGTSAPVYTNTASVYVGASTSAVNLFGGATGSLPYQTAANATGMLAISATAGALLTSNSTNPAFVTQVQAINGSASNTQATGQSLVVSAGGLGVTGNSYFANQVAIGSNNANTSSGSANAFYVVGGSYFGNGMVVQGAATFAGPVTFSGSATYILSTNTYYTDNLLEVHTPPGGVYSNWNSDDGKDIGLRFHYYNRSLSTDSNAALILANDTQILEWYGSGAESSTGTFSSATYGTFRTGIVQLRSGTANSNNATSGDLQVSGGAGVGGSLWVGGNVTVVGTITASVSGTITTATNIANGTAGQIHYQSAPGITAFAGPGTAGQILLSAGTSAPTYTNTASVYVGAASSAVNLFAGTAGQIHYQSAANTTAFLGTATTGNFLQANYVGAPTWTTTASMYVGASTSAVNIFGGTTGQLHYQSGAGTTAFAGPGTAGQLLVSGGAAVPVYTNTGSIGVGFVSNALSTGTGILGGTYNGSVAQTFSLNTATLMATAVTALSYAGSVTTASNIALGTAGQIPFQSGPGATTFAGPGTAGQILVSAGTSGPVYTNTASVYVGRASLADTATTATNAGFAYSFNTGTLVATAVTALSYAGSVTTATNIAAGTAGQLHYQSAPGVTAFAGPGTAGQLLVSGGAAIPVYTNTASIGVGFVSNLLTAGTGLTGTAYNGSVAQTWSMNTATLVATAVTALTVAGTVSTATQVNAQAQPASATYYPTFVNANNSSAVASSIYTTSSFVLNPATGFVGVGVTTPPGSLGNANLYALNGITAVGTATAQPYWHLYNPNAAANLKTWRIGLSDSTGAISFQTINDAYSVSTEYLKINSTGQVGVGTNYAGTNGALLAVNGGGFFNGIVTATTYYGTFAGTIGGTTTITTASNIAAGTTGQLHYQSAPGVTAFAGPGTTGQILLSAGAAAPVYTNTASVYVGAASSAVNLFGGTTGQLLYQSGAGTTGFTGPGTAGQLLVSAGASAPTYTNTASIGVGFVSNPLTAGTGVSFSSGSTYNGSQAITINVNTGTLSAVAVSAQTVNTVQSSGASATYYIPFVSANNASAAAMSLYTTSTFTVNPVTGQHNILGALYIGGDLYVDGTQFVLNTNVIATGDKALVLSTGSTSAILATGSGIYAGASSGTAYTSFYYDGANGWIAGGTNGGSLMLGGATAPVNGAKLTVTGGGQFSTILTATTLNLTNALGVAYGGTGLTTLATGSLVYGAGASAFSTLALGTAGYVLTAGASAPQWTAISGLTAGTASNLGGGSVGQVPYQTGAGATSFYGPGTAGQILLSGGSAAPTYVNTSGVYVGASTSAVNIFGGTTGQLHYQSGAGTTSFAGPGTAGQLLVSAGASAPVYTNTASIYVGAASSAVNLFGGSTGQFAYQSSAGVTAFISTGSMYVYRATVSDSAGTSGGTTAALTFNNGGAGAASGTTFNGGTAQTISYNTIGAPSTTGANASGQWGIYTNGIRQSDGTAWLTAASSIGSSGARGTDLAPNTYNQGIFSEFKNSSLYGVTGNYSGLITYANWVGTSASTGDPSYQLLFSPSSANATTTPSLRFRAGIDTTWGAWNTILHSGNIASFGVSSFSAGTTGFTPSSATAGAVTLGGTLNVSNGGTGLTSLTANYIPYGNGTSAYQSSSNLQFNGSTLSVGGTVYASVAMAIAGNGSSNDPYGTMSVTEPANASNYSYYGLTRAGNLGAGFGLTGTNGAIGLGQNSFWFGTATSTSAGVMGTGWLAFNGSSLSAVGEITAYASDNRLKTDIRPITNAVKKVIALNGIVYKWNDIAGAQGYDQTIDIVGLFAQDVQKVLPEAVKIAPFDADVNGGSKSGENYLTVQYEKVVPLLVEAIKEQQLMIEELRAQIQELKSQK